LSHRLCLGKKQLTILTPSPLCLTRRLCLPSQRLTSLDMCQEALPQMSLLAKSLELFSAPSEKLGRYGTHGPPVHKPDPRIVELWHIESVAGDRFGLGIVFSDQPLEKAQRRPSSAQLFKVGKASLLHQHSSSKPTAQVSKLDAATLISRSLASLAYFLSYRRSGEVIHRLALCHLTLRRRIKVARMVSTETRSFVSPSSKAT
jgi:hypothetical protein